MTIKSLYKIIRPDGGVTISTAQPDSDYVPYLRLIADEGKVLTNGVVKAPVVDVPDGDQGLWQEVDDEDQEMTAEEVMEMIGEVM